MTDPATITVYQELYDQHGEYIRRRNQNTYDARRVLLEAKTYKIPHLLAVLPYDYHYETVAEIGCATGDLLAFFPTPAGGCKVGFDISPLNVAAARERFPAIEFRAQDFTSSNERFDLVILSDVVEHVENDAEFLRRAANMAGLVLLNLPLERCLSTLGRKYGPGDVSGHLRKYGLHDARVLAKAAGLTIVAEHVAWAIHSDYEELRRKLNREMFGRSFRGSQTMLPVKTALVAFTDRVRSVARQIWPSNYFAALRT